MHANRPGDRPRLLYWYRTAPEIGLGRSPLDEDAIRTIEEQHPDIDFDWPAILALSEVMTPEDEASPTAQLREQRQGRRRSARDGAGGGDADSARRPPDDVSARAHSVQSPRDDRAATSSYAVEPVADTVTVVASPPPIRQSSLVDQLAGREIAARLRGRYAEITLRIQGADDASRESLMTLAEALDPDRWDTPDAVLQGVSHADALFEQLRIALATP